MELRAVIEGLRALKESCDVTVFTDSQYVQLGIVEWLPLWKARGWKKQKRDADGNKDVKNRDLWEDLDREVQRHSIDWQWVKGHATHKDNRRCDYLALKAAKEQSSSNGVVTKKALPSARRR